MNYLKTIFAVFVFVMLLPVKMMATAQRGEVIFIDGKKYSMFTCPLNENKKLVKKLFRVYPYRFFSTALWRGYVGYWSIKNETLYLDSIHIGRNTTIVPIEEKMFSRYKDENGVKASWYSGELRVIDGKLLRYVHMGFESVYTKESYLAVKKGVVGESRQVENDVICQSMLGDTLVMKEFNEAFMRRFPNSRPVGWHIMYSKFDDEGKPVEAEVKTYLDVENRAEMQEFVCSYLIEKCILGVYRINNRYYSDSWGIQLGNKNINNNKQKENE